MVLVGDHLRRVRDVIAGTVMTNKVFNLLLGVNRLESYPDLFARLVVRYADCRNAIGIIPHVVLHKLDTFILQILTRLRK